MRSAIALFTVALPACGLQHTGLLVVGQDAALDGASDAGVADGGDGGCTQAVCLGACVPSCAGCNAGEAMCPTTHVCGRCGDCPGSELECFACDDAGVRMVFCSSPKSKCSEMPNRCPCPGGGIEQCPSQGQTCVDEQCRTCGEDGTDRATCANGKTCDANAAPPACR